MKRKAVYCKLTVRNKTTGEDVIIRFPAGELHKVCIKLDIDEHEIRKLEVFK